MTVRRRVTGALVVVLLGGAAVACTSSSGTNKVRATSPATSGPTSSAAATAAGGDWPMYHGRADHSGFASAMPNATGTLKRIAAVKLDGAVYGSPVVVRGRTFVVTENNSVYAFDPAYRQVWKAHFGGSSPEDERPCGDIDPLGITSTPIVVHGTLYVVAELGRPVRHVLIAIATSTGKQQWQRSIDLPGATPVAMQQRGALAVTGGRVWASFGALAGDCGNYKGRVVGVPLGGTGATVKYDPSTRRQGGIWNPAGPTVDARGHLLVVSANGSSGPGDEYDHTNSVDELDPNGRLVDSFAPSDWARNNADDVGLGSQGVALVGTKWAVLGGKSGPVYVLRQGKLGGIGGEVGQRNICKSFGGAAVVRDVVYLPCTDGVRAVRVDDAGKLTVLWHASTSITGSPVVGGDRVWGLAQDDGVLHALDPDTGRSKASVTVGATSRFATPAISGAKILVPTLTGLTVVQTSAGGSG